VSSWPSATTRLVALLGDPVRHSLSPLMHNAAFREQGIDYVYLALPTAAVDLRRVVDVLGTIEAVGANVTIPHKETVVGICDRLTEEADLVGAVNTLTWTADGLLGENTDAIGLGQVLRDDIGLPGRASAAVLGTGGAARACAVALGRTGSPVTFIGRRLDAAEELAALAERCGAEAADGLDLTEEDVVGEAVATAALVVNATPLGMAGERLPGAFHHLTPGQIALDLVYRPPETPFLRSAREAGAETVHGVGMLVAQAAVSYRLWTGREAPTATMSAVALSALAGR
jgi:shikimate dehydrogenase